MTTTSKDNYETDGDSAAYLADLLIKYKPIYNIGGAVAGYFDWRIADSKPCVCGKLNIHDKYGEMTVIVIRKGTDNYVAHILSDRNKFYA